MFTTVRFSWIEFLLSVVNESLESSLLHFFIALLELLLSFQPSRLDVALVAGGAAKIMLTIITE